ncbi:hypothetical protein MHA_0698 [Mannheimia haemolytica PHL213]|nr:hypothetical protein MHA_0698 [Mannheimia haemolytica PHL213]
MDSAKCIRKIDIKQTNAYFKAIFLN